MEIIHIILGSMVKQLSPIIIKYHSINLLISLGKANLETPLFTIKEIVEYNDYKNIDNIRKTVNKLLPFFSKLLNKDPSVIKTYVCLSTQTTKDTIMMSYLSQALNSTSYYADKENLIELYPYRIEHISPLEFKILESISTTKTVESLKELMDIIKFNEPDTIKATAKMGYIVNKLVRASFVKREKDGRSVQVSITPQGKQYVLLFGKNYSHSKLINN